MNNKNFDLNGSFKSISFKKVDSIENIIKDVSNTIAKKIYENQKVKTRSFETILKNTLYGFKKKLAAYLILNGEDDIQNIFEYKEEKNFLINGSEIIDCELYGLNKEKNNIEINFFVGNNKFKDSIKLIYIDNYNKLYYYIGEIVLKYIFNKNIIKYNYGNRFFVNCLYKNIKNNIVLYQNNVHIIGHCEIEKKYLERCMEFKKETENVMKYQYEGKLKEIAYYKAYEIPIDLCFMFQTNGPDMYDVINNNIKIDITTFNLIKQDVDFIDIKLNKSKCRSIIERCCNAANGYGIYDINAIAFVERINDNYYILRNHCKIENFLNLCLDLEKEENCVNLKLYKNSFEYI